jgi:Cys-tRNA(Pro) deacylase
MRHFHSLALYEKSRRGMSIGSKAFFGRFSVVLLASRPTPGFQTSWPKGSKRVDMEKVSYPITPAVRLLREKKISFRPHLYAYQEHGGTSHAASALNLPEHAVIKTIVMETDGGKPLIVLMHGDREVSGKQLARTLKVKSVSPCEVANAERLTGYKVGGISPFGTHTPMPVYVEETVLDLPAIYLNGGKRGFLVEFDPACMRSLLPVTGVSVATASRESHPP